MPRASVADFAQITQPGQVFQYHLQQRLGDGQTFDQNLVAMDTALSHELQQFFQHDQNPLATW